MPETILVPLDGSALAERALPVAEGMARAMHAHLILARSTHASTFPGVDPTDGEVGAISKAQAYLEVRASLVLRAGLTVETAVLYGEAASTLTEEIHIRRADLVVMATHGRSGPDRWVHGSVAETVLRRSPVPVVVIPPRAPHAWPIDRSPSILVPLDTSELSEASLGPTTALAAGLGARLVLLQVEQPPPAGAYGEPTVYPVFDPRAEVEAAKRHLAGVAAHLRSCVRDVRVEYGQPVPTIIRVADEEHVDLIAMATHGRTGLARLVLGSVATGVLQQASLPLVLIRPRAVQTQPTAAGA
jgi:nucleotide-binding universal stress UspA family protein